MILSVVDGRGKSGVISVDDAWRRIAKHLESMKTETVPRRRSLGRVLAAELVAITDVPGTTVSAMDGYALAGPGIPGVAREVVGVVSAGDAPGMTIAAGQAVQIMTGAPVPEGTDRVVPVEQTDGGHDVVQIVSEPAAGAHIRRCGEIVSAGEPLMRAGALLTPGALALLATHGYEEVRVHGSPRVAILTTGDEVVVPSAVPQPGQLRDSHTDFLLAAGRTLGLEFSSLGIAPDRAGELRRLVELGLRYDVLLVGSGVSMGEYDLVEDVLAELGCELLFDAVAIQPGKPLVVARHDGGWVFGLPGNPASVMACFWLFVRPVLRCLMGARDGFWQGALTGKLSAPLPGAKDRDRFLPAEVAFSDGRLLVAPLPPKGSHDLGAYACGTALVRIAAGAQPQEPGASCEILPLADWRSVS